MLDNGVQFNCHGLMVGDLGYFFSVVNVVCCFVRKKKGEMPTGIMAHIAKASGCASVHDLLEKGSDVVAAAQAILKVNAGEKVILFCFANLC